MMKKLASLIMACAFVTTVAMAQRMTDGTVHDQYILAVDEFVPAPGQFVNELPKYETGDDAERMAAKCTAIIAGAPKTGSSDSEATQGLISLGAWGGYVTFHFDHSIANIDGSQDLHISGNAFAGNSEAGIVMVSKDVNGNGLPDDPWYELSGSCDVDSVGKVVYGYELTYTRNPMDDIPWIDNQGGSGNVERNAYHEDNEYFPQWLSSPLTFSGTRLPDNMWLKSKRPPTYVLDSFRYGYVDNLSNDATLDDGSDACGFDFDWAVDPISRQRVEIDFVDFVRVYTGINQMVPNYVGETSTEISCAYDLHLEQSIEAILQATAISEPTLINARTHQIYSTNGQRLQAPQRGINIVRTSDGRYKKIIIQ